MACYQEYLPGWVPPARADVVLFDAEAVEETEAVHEADAVEGEAAVDAEPVPDSEAETQLLTATGQTPEP